jgi:dephospho-CoA kinase
MTSSRTARAMGRGSPMNRKLRIGLTGRMGSGKGEVVRLLEAHGFRYASLSDMVRAEAARLGRPVSRAEMQDIGNRLRREGGAGVLGRRVRGMIEASPVARWVIDGVRNPAEVEELRQLDGFVLLAVEADVEVILQRMQQRGRDTDRASDDELRQRLAREWGENEPEGGQRVGACMQRSDHTLPNNGPLEELATAVERLLAQLGGGDGE